MEYSLYLLYMFAICSIILTVLFVFFVHPYQSKQNKLNSLRIFSTAIEKRAGVEGRTDEAITLAKEIAKQLSFSKKELDNLITALHLCDIGYVTIPFYLLRKKKSSQITHEEYEIIKRHPEISAGMLSFVPPFLHVADIVRCHHVRFAGSSEKFLPIGEDIPIESRVICAVCEYLDVRDTRGEYLASEYMRVRAGYDYCPSVVRALLAVLKSHGEFGRTSISRAG